MDAIPKQDMPPPGGYSRIFYQRTFAKTWINWKKFTVIFVAVHAWALMKYKYYRMKQKHYVVEQNDVKCALDPFLLAERDRLWLRTMQRMRNEEDEVMKDVPGWKTGTWYGEPIYFTLPPDKWWDMIEGETFDHSRSWDTFLYNNYRNHPFSSPPRWYDKYLPEWFADYYMK